MKSLQSASTIPPFSLDHKRDAYGFAVRPQHFQRYREYSTIYKEEEEERSDRWKIFLERVSESIQSSANEEKVNAADNTETHSTSEVNGESQTPPNECVNGIEMLSSEIAVDNGVHQEEKKIHKIQIWSEIRPSLRTIEDMMSVRVRKRSPSFRKGRDNDSHRTRESDKEDEVLKGGIEDDSDEEFYDLEKSDSIQDGSSVDINGVSEGIIVDSSSPWREELEVLVRGGLPMALRGELWQAFVGVKARRIEKYYDNLLLSENNHDDILKQEETNDNNSGLEGKGLPEKWKGQIEKDLPRTFPGHPALDENGRNALRRLLIAYARHNPSVGYCQAMNFFAGLLLLLMSEENAFWALVGIMDDYFEGYYSEEMIEYQVDQHVFEVLVRERFPKLVNHLDYLGVQVAWITGPWFLSIFMNMLPWESVLRVWDVLLFEGNRVMLFRTALALMELYGPALVTTKDAGDAVTLLQSLAGSTFDSSQLVLTACMGYQNVNEARLQELRNNYRPTVISAIEERSKGLEALKKSQGLVSKLYSFKHDKSNVGNGQMNGETMDVESDGYYNGTEGGVDSDPGSDIQEQIVWLKIELCKLMEEKRSAELRAEELETALMEMVKQDNRRELSARVEQLEQEVSELHRVLADKREQESAMLQVLMRVEQEQKVTEDARRYAEQEAESQRLAAQSVQEKYEKAIASLAEMEQRLVMAESMLEATLQYQSGQMKAQSSPRPVNNDSPTTRTNMEPTTDVPARKVSLLTRPFGLGWRDKNKEKTTSIEESSESKATDDVQSPVEDKRSSEFDDHNQENPQISS